MLPLRSRSWKSALTSMCGQGWGAVHLLSEQGEMLGTASFPRGLQQAQDLKRLVGRLSMHPEAVDTCVLRVAPVGQDPKFHNLVCGHLRGLEVEGLDGLPILVVGKRAKKCPFLLQVFIEALQKSMQKSERATTLSQLC